MESVKVVPLSTLDKAEAHFCAHDILQYVHMAIPNIIQYGSYLYSRNCSHNSMIHIGLCFSYETIIAIISLPFIIIEKRAPYACELL